MAGMGQCGDRNACVSVLVFERYTMIKHKRRFKQTATLQERLAAFAEGLREETSRLSAGSARTDVSRRVGKAETASRSDE
jgi:hypothetical protein